jgi:hypothetical protein
MFKSLRKPFFIAAIVCLLFAVLIEIGSGFALEPLSQDTADKFNNSTPGFGISSLAFLDGLLLFSLLSMSATLVISERVYGRIQGIITLVVSLLTLIGAIAMIFTAIGLLILMFSLLMAIPIGTAVYMAEFSVFPTDKAAKYLGLIMSFKFAFVILLLMAHQSFVTVKGLVLLVLTSFLATIIVSFLHAIVPVVLVSITDDVAAIIVAILAAIWALVYLVGSIPAVIKALRIDRAVS